MHASSHLYKCERYATDWLPVAQNRIRQSSVFSLPFRGDDSHNYIQSPLKYSWQHLCRISQEPLSCKLLTNKKELEDEPNISKQMYSQGLDKFELHVSLGKSWL